jgi:hypothetical protein
MKRSSAIPILLGVLLASAVCALVLAYGLIQYSRKTRRLQPQVALVTNGRAIMTSLANEALEYVMKNPAIDPILVSARIKEGPQPQPAASKPATK